MNSWLPLLKSLKLSQADQLIVERFEKAPSSRVFLPVAEILLHHSLQDEALELLISGVDQHPGYTAARVILARELLQKGMCEEAYRYLEAVSTSLKENVLAQKIFFKLALIEGKEFVARETFDHMRRRSMVDDEIKEWGDKLRFTPFSKLREEYRAHLAALGIPLTLKKSPSDDKRAVPKEPSLTIPLPDVPLVARFDEGFLHHLEGYHYCPLKDLKELSEPTSGHDEGKLSTESVTMALIYEKQGLTTKAFEIYKRLLNEAPQSDWLRQKLQSLEKAPLHEASVLEQLNEGDLAGRVFHLEQIDRKIALLNQLLERLEHDR